MADGGAEIRAAAKAVRSAREKSLRKSGNEARRLLLKSGAKATGGDLIFSGAVGRATALGVKTKYSSGASSSNVLIKPTGKTAGMWAWANTGTSAGYRKFRRRNGGMQHPGTSGWGAWDKAQAEIERTVVEDLRQSLRVVLR